MLQKILALKDNYIWIVHDSCGFCVIIDPGQSFQIIQKIKREQFKPIAILLTHNHSDHINGISEIMQKYPSIIIYGPQEIKKCQIHNIVKNGMKIKLLNRVFHVLSTPGHTSGHVSYYTKPYIFCGDTMFSGGCGRVSGGKYMELYNSIHTILNFPENTLLCCSHEYTLSNLIFALSILPKDSQINKYYEQIKKKNVHCLHF